MNKAVENILAFAAGKEYAVGDKTIKGKKRNFVETVELQIGELPALLAREFLEPEHIIAATACCF